MTKKSKVGSGRKRKATPKPKPTDANAGVEKKICDSMAQAAQKSGYPIEVLKLAKVTGCGAFRGSRVYVTEFNEWMKDHPELIKDASPKINKAVADARKAMADAEIREHRLKVMRGEFVKLVDVQRKITICIIQAKSRLLGNRPALASKISAITGGEVSKIEKAIADRDYDFLDGMSKMPFGKFKCECGRGV